MAYINVDEVYILDNTGLQVDQTTDLPFKDAGLTESQQAQARKNIAAGGSNDNLLDNAYFVGGGSQLGDGHFPINQREQTSYSAYTNSIDRWYAAAAMTVAADGISCGAIVQKLPQVAPLDGKTLTFSALLADGTMLSGSAVFNSASDTYFYYDAGASEYLLYNTYFGGFEVVTPRKIAAVKLELGTVSTLANDVPPNFSAEFEKCRYYLRYIPLTRYAIAIDGANAYMTMIGMPMHGVPTPSLTTAGGVRDAGGQSTITSATVTGFANKIATVQFALSASRSYVVGYIYDTVLCLAAEL